MTSEQGLVERLRDDARAFTRRLGIEPERSIGWEAADRLEAQAAENAELQAEVERWKQTAEDQQALRLRREADLKRALDTARHDAMEEADELDAATAALVALAEAGIPTDIQELLVRGDPLRSIAPGALSKCFRAAIRSLRFPVIAGRAG